MRLNRLKQLKRQAGVAAGRAEALAALPADRPTTDVTATPAASTEQARAKRLRMKISFLFGNSPARLPVPEGLGGKAISGNGWRRYCTKAGLCRSVLSRPASK